jgi:hypothetical protein
MYKIKILFIIFLISTFLAGGYFYVIGNKINEGLEDKNEKDEKHGKDNESTCPDILIRSGSTLLLINSKLPKSDTNPLPFYSLDEYINYLEIQKKKGIVCPVLFLQEETNTQGNNVYRVRSGPLSQEESALPTTTNIYNNIDSPFKTIDASRENGEYNKNQYAGFDPTGLYIGRYTDLDKIHNSTEMAPVSDNPMDQNWGGVIYTHNTVASGKYKDNEVMSLNKYQNAVFEEKSDNIHDHSRVNNIYS